jgi:hypothetical protein
LQDLDREGIPNVYLSVDRTDEAYIYTKTLINNGLLHMPDNKLLHKELAELRYVDRKVDHTSTGCFRGDTKILCKDINENISYIRFDFLIKSYNDYKVLSYNGSGFEWSNINNVSITRYVNELVKLKEIELM